MAIVEYAKPFRKSHGVNGRRLSIVIPPLPDAKAKLHDRLLSLRDQALAHSDLSIKEAKVYVDAISGQPFPLIMSNADPSLPSPAAVRALVESVLDALYARIPDFNEMFRDPA